MGMGVNFKCLPFVKFGTIKASKYKENNELYNTEYNFIKGCMSP